MRALLAALLVGLWLGAGAGAAMVTTAPDARTARVAKVVANTVVRERPGAGRVLWTAPSQTPSGGNATWLLVVGDSETRRGRWVEVLLPVRPNGTTGWIQAERLQIGRTRWSVEVSVGRRTLAVRRDGRVVATARVVVGAPATPTPLGRFALYDVVRQRDAGGFLGPWALHLTAFSTVLEDYGGGPGRVAIHGRGGASLRDPLGSASSHGCIRVDNDRVAALSLLPPGSPVTVRP